MLKDEELKRKKKEIDQIEAEWSKAQKDIMKAMIAVSDAQADIVAREQSKNKLLAQGMENERKYKYNAPVSSQDDINMIFATIQKFSEQEKLALMRKEIKFKKMVFSELPSDFVLFKQYNIFAKNVPKSLGFACSWYI